MARVKMFDTGAFAKKVHIKMNVFRIQEWTNGFKKGTSHWRTFLNTCVCFLQVCTVHQQYQGTFLLFQIDAHNYKIIGILKQLKFRLSLRHVSVHAGTIIRERFRA